MNNRVDGKMPNFHAHHNHDSCVHDDQNLSNHSHVHKKNDHGHDHSHDYKNKSKKILMIVMVMTFVFAFVELFAGLWSGSLALIADFCHMLTDSAALMFALIMAHLSQKPANKDYSFGHGRADTVGAFVNALFMLGIIGFIVFEAVQRILHPEPVKAEGVIIVASIGLAINLIAIYLLKDEHSLNTKSAMIHVLGDLLGSVATIIAGVAIYFTNITVIDPILSLVVSLIILKPTWILIKKSIRILMEGVPQHVEFEEVGKAIEKVKGVNLVHDLHIWTMNSDNTSLSAHIVIDSMNDWESTLKSIQLMLSKDFSIEHITLQPEVTMNDFVCQNSDIHK